MADNDDDLENEDEPKKPSGLRSALTAAQQRVAELETENATLKVETRKRSVAEALEQHGAKARLAKFYDSEGTSSDDVLAWLKENGEDFGWSEDSAGGNEDPDDEDTVREAQRINRASTSAPQKTVGRNVTRESLATGDYAELKKQGLVL